MKVDVHKYNPGSSVKGSLICASALPHSGSRPRLCIRTACRDNRRWGCATYEARNSLYSKSIKLTFFLILTAHTTLGARSPKIEPVMIARKSGMKMHLAGWYMNWSCCRRLTCCQCSNSWWNCWRTTRRLALSYEQVRQAIISLSQPRTQWLASNLNSSPKHNESSC